MEERTERGRAFDVDAAADWKDRSLMVERIVCGIIKSEDKASEFQTEWALTLKAFADKAITPYEVLIVAVCLSDYLKVDGRV